MSVSAAAKGRFLDALSSARPITSRAMFGGIGIYLDEVFMGVIDDDRLYLKVDPQTEGEYLARGMAQWSYDGGKTLNPYREMPEDVLNDPEQCGIWLEAARDAAIRLKAKPKKKKA